MGFQNHCWTSKTDSFLLSDGQRLPVQLLKGITAPHGSLPLLCPVSGRWVQDKATPSRKPQANTMTAHPLPWASLWGNTGWSVSSGGRRTWLPDRAVFLFGFILFGTLSFLGLVACFLFQIKEILSHYFIQTTSLALSLPLLLLSPIMQMLVCLVVS